MQNTMQEKMQETMQEAVDGIPPDAWPLIDFLMNATLICVAVWVLISLFVYIRRRASNLTPVHSAKTNKKASPDFLKVDTKARKQAIERGDDFEKDLRRAEKEEARAHARALRGKATLGQKIAGLASLLMSLFTLATMVFGAIFHVSRMGTMMTNYSSGERITKVIETHPIAFSVAAFVIFYQIYRYFAGRKWKES